MVAVSNTIEGCPALEEAMTSMDSSKYRSSIIAANGLAVHS